MFGSYQGTWQRRYQSRLRFLLALYTLVIFVDSVMAQRNITLDDTDLYILYAPAQSWHASTVECDTCLSPVSSLAHGGTWHDGTHIIPTVDEDDEGFVGDLDGDGTTSVPAITGSSSTSSAQPAQTSATTNVSTDDDDDHDDDDDDGDGDRHGGKGKNSSRRRRFTRYIRTSKRRSSAIKDKRDDENPFEVQSVDADDAGFQDVPVTATLDFTGQAVHVFAILPLFPAPPNTTPTFTNLSFTLDGASHGVFTFRPDATAPTTPTVNSPASEKFQFDVNIFSAAGLDDTNHSLVINVGVDSVLLLDYVIYTAGPSDPASPGSLTAGVPDSERTAGTVPSSASSEHNVATFAGAVGGSFGLLSVIALSLCISIKCRRHRARVRETRARAAYAQTFTGRDHGDDGPDDDEENGFGRQENGPDMAQANPAPFVPRYFPGSLPSSPPPYAPQGEGDRVIATSPLTTSINRAGLPVAVPSTLPPIITLPTATLDLQRTTSNNSSNSYADRPPPTPPAEDARISLFGPLGVREERNLNGGIIGPLPIDTPSQEESDPMLSVDVDDEYRRDDRPPARMMREEDSESISSRTFGTARSSRESSSSSSSGTASSSAYTPPTLPTSSSSSMRTKLGDEVSPNTFPTLSTSTSLPSMSAPQPTRPLSSPSFPDLVPKPITSGELSSLAYPVLNPSRVPLPPSLYGYGSDIGSQETLERRDTRT